MPSKPDTASHLGVPFRVLARPYLKTLYVISQSIWISQLGLGALFKLSFIEKNMDCFTVTWEKKNNLFVFYNAMLWKFFFPG